MEKEYYPVVVQAVAGPGRTVYAYFSDGQVKCYDMRAAIERGGVFAPWQMLETEYSICAKARDG